MSGRVLVRGGRILAMTDGAAETPGDLLIEGSRIAAIGPHLAVDDAGTIDARGMLVLPGFVDTHRHVWQTQLRTVAADWSLFNYFTQMRLVYASLYTADDAHLGNLAGALEALNAGVTTVVDHCHVLNSPEHADAAIAGLDESGIRAVFCYGLFPNPTHAPFRMGDGPGWRFDDARRLRRTRLAADDARLVMGLAPAEVEGAPFAQSLEEIRFAREVGARRISCHVAMGAYDLGLRFVERLAAAGALAEDILAVHGAALTDDELARLRDAGAAISSTPETELQMGMGFPVLWRARRAGVRAGLGVDIASNCSGDMFAPMRLALQVGRALENEGYAARGAAPRAIRPTTAEVLRVATCDGAEVAGLGDRIGTLAVGKEADLILVRTDGPSMVPAVDAAAALVLNATAADVDTVFVAGRAVKRGGVLVGVDWPAIATRLVRSRERIAAGFGAIDVRAIEAGALAFFPRLA